MGILVTTDDFNTGEYLLPINTQNLGQIDALIDENEENYLRQLLGNELFDLFEADLVNRIPQTARFVAIYDPIQEDNNSCPVVNRGMKTMIKGLLFFKIARELNVKLTQTGFGRAESDVNPSTGWLPGNLFRKQNAAVDDADVIQWYINENSSTYPEYAGIEISRASWL